MRIMTLLIVATTVSGAPAALAQTTGTPNSGAGVQGAPGNKSGPAVKEKSEQAIYRRQPGPEQSPRIARQQIGARTAKAAEPVMDSRAVNFGGLLFVGVRSVVGNQRQAKSG